MKKIIYFSVFICLVIVLSGCEREGTVDISDCREAIDIKEDSIRTLYKTFTCNYYKTQKGDIISGSCINIETSIFGNKCKRAYIYEKSPSLDCGENAFLNTDGNCYCKSGYIFDKESHKCL